MVQSLNISVACAIILYEAFRQKFAAGHYDKPALPDEDIKKIMDKWTDYKIVREKKQRKP
jgi:tRNA (guanosine-2'-O-)-methyltransferase